MFALAIVALVAILFVLVIDGISQFDSHALRIKWSLAWYAARYIAIIAASLVLLDVVFGDVC